MMKKLMETGAIAETKMLEDKIKKIKEEKNQADNELDTAKSEIEFLKDKLEKQ